MIQRNLETTVTGWRWLDRLTQPYWAVTAWWGRRRLFSLIGRGDRRRGELLFRDAAAASADVCTDTHKCGEAVRLRRIAAGVKLRWQDAGGAVDSPNYLDWRRSERIYRTHTLTCGVDPQEPA